MVKSVSTLAGLKPEDLPPPLPKSPKAPEAPDGLGLAAGGKGGPYIPVTGSPSLEGLQHLIGGLDEATERNTDLFTLVESRLLESRLRALMVPSAAPVNGPVGSGFGFRTDPFSGRAALHTGLDFPAEPGTPIQAAAGGVVVLKEVHPAYGNVIEIDHGNGLVTRYAHCSSIEVNQGDLVKRGQLVARVGTSGRSTGPHLHFEVLVDGVPQDPARFLAGGPAAKPAQEFAARPTRR